MTETEHAADEAGGEVVYASDGLPCPPIALPERVSSTAAVNDDHDQTVLDSGAGTSATQAFEVFSGKLYPVKTTATGSSSSAGTYETPTQRLARLQQEVVELERDLSSTASSTEEGPALVQLVADLKTRLETQAGVAKHQHDMTRTMHQQLEEWHAAKKATTSTAAAADRASEPQTGVVYELYGGVGVPRTSWEERLLQVEALVGSNAGSATSNQSLLSRLQGMETLLQNLDPKALEQASAKAKVIRSDLEAASKARNKLASAATFRKEDAKTISALYDQMVQLEGLSDHLPALVARLQQLANLHAQNSSFSGRLMQSEKEVTQLQTFVKQLEETVAKVETGVVENVKVVEQNMKQLDERLKQL